MKRDVMIALLRDIDAALKDNDIGAHKRLDDVVTRALASACPGIIRDPAYVLEDRMLTAWILDGDESDREPCETSDYLSFCDDLYTMWQHGTDPRWLQLLPAYGRKITQHYDDALNMLAEWDWPGELYDHYRAVEEREAENARSDQGQGKEVLDVVDAPWQASGAGANGRRHG